MMLRRTRSRSAFTMIELIVVILIIVILGSLLLSAVGKVLVYVDEVRTLSDVKQLEQACESFKERYGRYPPSRIALIENGAYDPTIPLHAYSLNYLTSLFPGIYLSSDPTNPAGFHQHNWNGSLDNNSNPTYDAVGFVRILEGNQCLAYFLGGIAYFRPGLPAVPIEALQGFCTDKTRPTLYTPTRTREGPFMELSGARLVIGAGPNGWLVGADQVNPATWTGIWYGYADQYGSPYAYFLARDSSSSNYPCLLFRDANNNPLINDCQNLTGNFIPYYSSGAVTVVPAQTPVRFFRPDKFQIISAGKDRVFGTGGNYNEGNQQASALASPLLPLIPNAYNELADADNLVNFTEGRLIRK